MPNPTPEIRRLTDNDAPDYQKLRLQALQTDPAAFLATYESEGQKSVQQFASELTWALREPIFGYSGIWLAKQLAAYVQLEQGFFPKQQHVTLLFNLYVSPEFRGQGVATALISSLLEKCQQIGIEVVVVSHNGTSQAAHQLYEKLGFTQCGVKPKWVKYDGVYDDEVEMVKMLKNK